MAPKCIEVSSLGSLESSARGKWRMRAQVDGNPLRGPWRETKTMADSDLARARCSTTRASYIENVQALFTGRGGAHLAKVRTRLRIGSLGAAKGDSAAMCALSSCGGSQLAQAQKQAQEVPSSNAEVRRRFKRKQQVESAATVESASQPLLLLSASTLDLALIQILGTKELVREEVWHASPENANQEQRGAAEHEPFVSSGIGAAEHVPPDVLPASTRGGSPDESTEASNANQGLAEKAKTVAAPRAGSPDRPAHARDDANQFEMTPTKKSRAGTANAVRRSPERSAKKSRTHTADRTADADLISLWVQRFKEGLRV